MAKQLDLFAHFPDKPPFLTGIAPAGLYQCRPSGRAVPGGISHNTDRVGATEREKAKE